MDHEDSQFVTRDRFYKTGLRLMKKEKWELREWNAAREEEALRSEREREERVDVELLEGRLKREVLKKAIFTYLDD